MPKPSSRTSRRSGQLRIIAGEWRGRRLPVAAVPGLRPTPDRVRETLFNWLAPFLPGARCLDLFAGSGALGLEALSRGAASCLFMEQSRAAARQLEAALAELGAGERARVYTGDALRLSARQCDPGFDIVFLDPPFRCGWTQRCLAMLAYPGYLAGVAWVYLESGVDETLPTLPGHWHLHRQRVAGQVSYRLFRVAAAEGLEPGVALT